MQSRRWLPLWPMALMVVASALLGSLLGSPAYEPAKGAALALFTVVGLATTARTALQRGLARSDRKPWVLLIAYWATNMLTSASFMIAFSGGAAHPPKQWALLLAAISWILQVVPMLACLLAFPSQPMTRSERNRFALDMTAVAGGGFIALWYTVLSPAINSSLSSSRMITIVQPVVMLVVIFAICAVMMRGGVTGWRHPLTFLLIGNVVSAAGQIALGFVLAHSVVAHNVFGIDLMAVIGNVAMLMAPIMQRRGVGRGQLNITALGHRRPTILPYVALGLGYSMLVSAAFTTTPSPWVGLIAGALVMTGAVAGRQIIALRENHNFVVKDTLTGLSSRAALYDSLNRAVERSNRTLRPAAVLLIDLNGFKPVNDRLGHHAGDELLIAFGEVLRKSVRSGDTTGRLGGDEFAVILPDVTDTTTALCIADAIVTACETPFTAAGEKVKIGVSIGVSITETDKPVQGQELLRQADVAMYHIKRQRSAQHVAVYDIGMDLDPASLPEPTPMPGLDTAELAELDRLRSRVAELENKGARQSAASHR